MSREPNPYRDVYEAAEAGASGYAIVTGGGYGGVWYWNAVHDGQVRHGEAFARIDAEAAARDAWDRLDRGEDG